MKSLRLELVQKVGGGRSYGGGSTLEVFLNDAIGRKCSIPWIVRVPLRVELGDTFAEGIVYRLWDALEEVG